LSGLRSISRSVEFRQTTNTLQCISQPVCGTPKTITGENNMQWQGTPSSARSIASLRASTSASAGIAYSRCLFNFGIQLSPPVCNILYHMGLIACQPQVWPSLLRAVPATHLPGPQKTVLPPCTITSCGRREKPPQCTRFTAARHK